MRWPRHAGCRCSPATAQVRPDFAPVARRIRAEATDDWDDAVAVGAVREGGRTVPARRGRDRAPRSGAGRRRGRSTARRGVVVATGAGPVRPPIPGLAGDRVLDQPRGGRRDRGTGVPGRARRRGDRAGAGAGVRAVRHGRHGRRGRGPGAAGGGTGGVRAGGRRARRGGRAVARRAACRRGVPERALRGDRSTTARSSSGDELLVAVGRRPADGGARAWSTTGSTAARVPVDGRMRAADGLWAVGDVTGVGGVHPPRRAPGPDRRRRHPRPRGPARRLARAAAGHVHRPGDRLGRPDRGRRPRRPGSHVVAGCAPVSALVARVRARARATPA